MALELWRPRGLARSPLRGIAREMEEAFDRFFRDWPRLWGEGREMGLAMDVIDRRDEVLVRVDVPGVSEKDLEVTVDNGVLTIRGQRREEVEDKAEDYYAAERWSGAFSRSLTLPAAVDADRIKATLRHGVLEIRLPKAKEAVGRRIEVKAA
jgi:HSP20 family protein